MKVDFVRFCYLYLFGGIYVDLDCECIGWWNDGDNKITQDF